MSTDTQTIAMICGVVIPILVGIITKLEAAAGLKAVLNFGLSGLASVLANIVPGDFAWQPFVIAWGSTWAVSVASYYGLWKPTSVAPAVQNATKGLGVG